MNADNSSYSALDSQESIARRSYRRTSEVEKQNLLRQVIEHGTSISQAARRLKINNSTAKVIVRKYKQEMGQEFKRNQRRTPSTQNFPKQQKEQPQPAPVPTSFIMLYQNPAVVQLPILQIAPPFPFYYYHL